MKRLNIQNFIEKFLLLYHKVHIRVVPFYNMVVFMQMLKYYKNKNQPQTNYFRSINPLKAAPVMALMTMPPSLLNAENLPEINPITNGVEFVMPDVQGTQQSEDTVSDVLKPEKVQYKYNFTTSNGKRYTMYYTDQFKEVVDDKTRVASIFIVSSDFKSIKDYYGNDLNHPAEMTKFVYHDIGEDKEFCSIRLKELLCEELGRNSKHRTFEMRLPDDVANKILYLFYDSNSELKATRILKKYDFKNNR